MRTGEIWPNARIKNIILFFHQYHLKICPYPLPPPPICITDLINPPPPFTSELHPMTHHVHVFLTEHRNAAIHICNNLWIGIQQIQIQQ